MKEKITIDQSIYVVEGVEPVEIEWSTEEHHYQNYNHTRYLQGDNPTSLPEPKRKKVVCSKVESCLL